LATFLRPVFAASRVQHVSDLHLKFALRPHHMYGSMADIQSATAEIRRGKKKEEQERTSSPRRYGRRDDPDLSKKRCQHRADEQNMAAGNSSVSMITVNLCSTC